MFIIYHSDFGRFWEDQEGLEVWNLPAFPGVFLHLQGPPCICWALPAFPGTWLHLQGSPCISIYVTAILVSSVLSS